MSAGRRRTAMTARRAMVAIATLTIAMAGCASKTVGSSSPSTSPAPSAIGSPPPNAQLSPQVLMLNSPAAPSPDTEQGRKAEAAELATSLLRLVTLPAGATPVTSPPAAGLTAAPESQETNRIAAAHTFFTVPGTIDSVLTFVQTHVPAGFTSNGGGWGGPPYTAEVDLYGAPTLAFQPPWLTVSVGLAGSLVGVRVDSQVIWLPVRTPAEFIPTTVQGATLVAAGYSQDATNKTLNLDATDARTLAATINALPTATDAAHGCPAISSEITVTFASTRKVVVTDSLCGVYLDVGDGANLQLSDPGILQPDLNRLLGLPGYWPLSESRAQRRACGPRSESEHHALLLHPAGLVAVDGHGAGTPGVRLPAAA